MFEDSLIESAGGGRTKRTPMSILISTVVHVILLVVLVLIPLIYTDHA